MKSLLAALLLVAFFSTINLNAQTSNVKIVSKKIETNESGTIKEIIFSDKKNGHVLRKNVYCYNKNGYIKEKVLYVCNIKKQWVPFQKVEYTYTTDYKPNYFVFTKWDSVMGDWSEEFQQVTYVNQNKFFMKSVGKKDANEALYSAK